jgi:hypothetical protein
MNAFQVISLHVTETPEGEVISKREVLEVQRTSKNVALDDADLIRTILHRKAWVVERVNAVPMRG